MLERFFDYEPRRWEKANRPGQDTKTLEQVTFRSSQMKNKVAAFSDVKAPLRFVIMCKSWYKYLSSSGVDTSIVLPLLHYHKIYPPQDLGFNCLAGTPGRKSQRTFLTIVHLSQRKNQSEGRTSRQLTN